MMSNTLTPETVSSERCAQLRLWLEENSLTPPKLAEMAGVSDVFMRVLLGRDTMPCKRHRQLVALGVPAELLPESITPVMGRPRKRVPLSPTDEPRTANA